MPPLSATPGTIPAPALPHILPLPAASLSIEVSPAEVDPSNGSTHQPLPGKAPCVQLCCLLLKFAAYTGCLTVASGVLAALPTVGTLCALGLHHKGPWALPENCGFYPPPPLSPDANELRDDYVSGRYGVVNLNDHPCGSDYAKRELNLRGGAVAALGLTGIILIAALVVPLRELAKRRSRH